MALSPHAAHGPRVMVVGKDPLVTRTITKLLELDREISVLGEAPSIGTAPIAELRPDIVILDEAGQPVQTSAAEDYLDQVAPSTKLCVLEALRDMTVREVLQTIKHLPAGPSQDVSSRHLHVVAAPAERDALAALSERELEVVRLVAEGLSNKEISSRLSLSDKTVKNHISHILAKMNLTARTQVAVYAIRAGLV
jgi:DNA-binding NarL/FixJ family response regulator